MTKVYLNLISFADDTRLYSGVEDVTDCDNLQFDLDTVYDWESSTNMFFNSKKFSYVSFSSNEAAYKSNVYIDPSMNIISPSTHGVDGVHLAVAHSPVAIGNFGGRLERVLMIAHGAIGNKMNNNIL